MGAGTEGGVGPGLGMSLGGTGGLGFMSGTGFWFVGLAALYESTAITASRFITQSCSLY